MIVKKKTFCGYNDNRTAIIQLYLALFKQNPCPFTPFKTFLIMKVYFIFPLLLFYFLGQSQTNIPASTKVLVFENLKKGNKKMINVGAVIRYRVLGSSKVYKGILEDIKTKGIVVNAQEIPFEECELIAGRVFSEQQSLGSLLLGAGATAAVFSTVFSRNPSTSLVILGGSVTLMSVGAILMIRKKHFNLKKTWKVYGSTLNYMH